MGVATEAVPVDHGEDDHSELTDEPHTDTGVASTSSEVVAVLNRVLLATAGVYNGSHRELDHNSVKKKEKCMLYSRFWLIGPLANRGSLLYGTNLKEQTLIEKIARVFFAYL